MGSITRPNSVIGLKIVPTAAFQMHYINSMSTGMPWPQTVATHYYAQ